jgi:hypothetical protein
MDVIKGLEKWDCKADFLNVVAMGYGPVYREWTLFPLRREVRSALRAAAPLAVHITQLCRVNRVAAFRAGREEGGAYLLRGELRAAGHALSFH